jgi:N utilization substance protein A
VGQRGARVQAVVAELAGEKIDVIPWNDDPAVFVANALSPAQVLSVDIDEERRIASVTVPERMLSLAIGREGQNARLAARLTGWRIDIRSDVSVAEAKAAAAAPQAEAPSTDIAEAPSAVVEDVAAATEEAPAKPKRTRKAAATKEAAPEENPAEAAPAEAAPADAAPAEPKPAAAKRAAAKSVAAKAPEPEPAEAVEEVSS